MTADEVFAPLTYLKDKETQISAQQKQIELLEQQVRGLMMHFEATQKVSPSKATQ